MSKDPAFLFYPNDWLGGTMGMTFEEKGAYMELLMMQFNRGHMTSHMIGQTIGQLWVNIEDKFEVDEKGLYYNARLQEEQIKRKRFTESRRNNISGKNQYSKPVKKVGHMTSHMENENINENRDIIVLNAFKKNVIETAKELSFSKSIVTPFLEHWTERDFESKCYAWQVPETFVIKSRLKGWKKNQINNKSPDHDISKLF